MSSNLEALRDNLGRLDERDREFAQSLLNQSETRGLSAKQAPWIDRLLLRATTVPATIGNVSAVLELMQRAGKRPRIVLYANDELKLKLTISGIQSSRPGTIAVTSPEKGFAYRKFFGRITLGGTFEPGRDATVENLPDIIALLKRLGEDPADTAAQYGKLLGECCFCELPLTDDRSLEAGYGPQCAKRYSLPWGTRA